MKQTSQNRQKGARAKKRGSEHRQKGECIRARVSPAEKQEVTAKAERAGMTEGEYIRRHCIDAPETRAARRPNVDRAVLAEVVGHLGRVGSNLNQLARIANFEKRLTDADELHRALVELVEVMDTALVAMGRTPKGHRGEE